MIRHRPIGYTAANLLLVAVTLAYIGWLAAISIESVLLLALSFVVAVVVVAVATHAGKST